MKVSFYPFGYARVNEKMVSWFFFVAVCITVVERFSQSLSDDVRKNPKLIEDEFRKFCKNTKTKENRFVSKKKMGTNLF